MRAGTGYCNIADSYKAGYTTVGKALENGSFERADIIFAFCGGNTDYDAYYRGIRSVVGENTPIIGGSAIGIITNDALSYSGSPAGALAVQCEHLHCAMAAQKNLDIDEKKAGRQLAESISRKGIPSHIIMFYDSIKRPPKDNCPPVMNASGPIITGIEDVLGTDVKIFGAGLIGDFSFNATKQFCIDHIADQSIIGFVPEGDFKLYHGVTHGLTPLDGLYHTITGIQGDRIFELDGKPIVRMIDEIYGHKEWRKQKPVDLIAIGVNHGRRYGIPKESSHVNRIITGVLPDDRGVGLFEPDLEKGMEIQFMLRDTGEIIDSARKYAKEIFDEISMDGLTPVFGFYFDCAGRASSQSRTTTEEAAEIQKEFNRNGVPLFGFYTGVEIAPLAGRSRGLDLTGVLIVFAE